MHKRYFWLVLSLGLLLSTQLFAQGTTWNVGDVFVAVGNGSYQVYSNNGVLKQTISDGLGGPTGGCAFDSQFNLYTTNFTNTKVVEFDGNSTAHGILQTIDTSAGGALNSQSVTFDAAGNFYVGNTGSATVVKCSPVMPPSSPQVYSCSQSFSPAADQVGAGWTDLAVDQKTLFYTSQGTEIKRFDVSGSGTQLSDFAVLSGSVIANGVRLLSPYDGSGGLLVAEGSDIAQLNTSGSVVRTYNVSPQLKNWLAVSLDPNGTSFWAGDFKTGKVVRFNIASGAVEVGPISTGAQKTLGGVCVKGGHQLNIVPLVFPAGNNVLRFAEFGNQASNNFNTWSAAFDQVLSPFILAVSASQGVDLTRFEEYFSGQATSSTPTLKPIPYAYGNPVVYRAENPPPSTLYSGNIQVYVAYHNPQLCGGSITTNCYTPPSCLSGGTNPRLFRDPSSAPPTDAAANHSFAFDFTTFVALFGKFGDPISGGTRTLNDYVVADRCTTVAGSSAFFNNPLPKASVNAGSVIPVKISVQDGSGNAVLDAVTFPNDITLSITDKNGNLVKEFFNPGNSFSFFILNGKSYAGNLDTTGLPVGLNSLCITSINKTTIGGVLGTGTAAGQFPPACQQINIVP